MKSKTIKRREAKARQESYNALTKEQRIAKLDAKFGKGKGATKERKRLEEK